MTHNFIKEDDREGTVHWRRLLKHYFNIHPNTQDSSLIQESVKQGTIFKGVNLWALIGAIFIASLGLNTNSTAVIIGAMLVSPLMGPIIAIGLSVATFNLPLLRFAWKNFVLFVVISLVISAFYFFISPLKEPTAELTARTFPTIYDVLIAFFGGTVGMISNGQKEKSNVIPGVAIATALMPPLCTAGYGIATGNISYFAGAMYLFTINTVMIAFASLAVSKFLLKMPILRYPNAKETKHVNRIVAIILIATILPSIYLAYTLVLRNVYEQQVNLFIKNELTENNIVVLSKNVSYNNRTVELYLMNSPSENQKKNLRKELSIYKIPQTTLVFKGIDELISSKQSNLNTEMQKKDLMITQLNDSLNKVSQLLHAKEREAVDQGKQNTLLAKQLNAISPQVVGVGVAAISATSSNTSSEICILIKAKEKLPPATKKQIERFAQIQYPQKKVTVIFN